MAEVQFEPSGVRPVLGTLTFGNGAQVDQSLTGVFLRSFCGAGCAKPAEGGGPVLLDTSRSFELASPHGDTESLLGDLFASFPSMKKRISVSTKVSPALPPHYSLSKESVIAQCTESLEKLFSDSVELLYLEAPDAKTDIEDTLAGIEQLHQEGKIKAFGLSNFAAVAVADICDRCKARGMILPTAYQVLYNVLTRSMEAELVPVLREFGLRLYAYNALAGGLLTGRYASVADLTTASSGRFSSQVDLAAEAKVTSLPLSQVHRERYAKDGVLRGVDILRQACAPPEDETPLEVQTTDHLVDGVRVRLEVTERVGEKPKGQDMANVALRWLLHHSCLKKDDGVILGVSRSEHLVIALGAWSAGPLSAELVQACDAAWAAASAESAPYC